jgi:ankyrin repeat protein
MRHAVTTALLLPMLMFPHAPRVAGPFTNDGVVWTAHTALAGAAAPVADAAMQGDMAAVRTLLTKGVDVNAPQGDGMTALHWAAQRGDSAMSAMLLRARASVRAATRVGAYQPLHIASNAGSTAIVKQLLAAKADARAVTTEGVTPLHLAAIAFYRLVLRQDLLRPMLSGDRLFRLMVPPSESAPLSGVWPLISSRANGAEN